MAGTLSLHDDDLLKVADGITSLAELRAIGGASFYESPPRRGRRTAQPPPVVTASPEGSAP
jgi:hypothetical protein